jgi:hypothetical protein
MWPQANIGIRTGAVSGLAVLDVDCLKGGTESLADLELSYRALPETVQQLTGTGQHYFLAHPGTYVKNGVETLGPGLDIRGDGGYVIAAPSLHANGKRYAWEVLHEPDDTALAPMPDWLLALCQEQTKGARSDASAPIPEHQRNQTLFRMGASMRARGFERAPILAALLEVNRTQCHPPITEAEVAKIAQSCMRYEAGGISQAKAGRNGTTPGPEPSDPYACPELPHTARVDHERAAEASIFLDDYIDFSKKWAPRAYEDFHEATALFVLSTAAARRVKVELGPKGVYTSLYQALASRTSLYTKTTAVDIALALLRHAGLRALLAHADATPQAFLRSLTLYVPPDYLDLSDEQQMSVRERLAFAGQKGWFYEEWGQHIQAMMHKEGPMAAFRGIMRRLDDHEEEFDSATISRGIDLLHKPYVTLLANVTPADLKPFLRSHSPLWRDGYIARFAFITPGDCPPGRAPFPEGAMTLPRPLVTALARWHKRLGIPQVALEPLTKGKGKDTGRFRPVILAPLRETTYTLSPDVRTAFYAYDGALRTLIAQRKEEDLDGSYVRFPMKALRIAALLASLHDDSSRYTIWPAQWYRGQQIAERWRQGLHRLMQQVSETEPVSRESKGEQRVLEVLRKHGALSVRDINRWSKLAHVDILKHLAVLSEAGAIITTDTPHAKKYRYVLDGDLDE